MSDDFQVVLIFFQLVLIFFQVVFIFFLVHYFFQLAHYFFQLVHFLFQLVHYLFQLVYILRNKVQLKENKVQLKENKVQLKRKQNTNLCFLSLSPSSSFLVSLDLGFVLAVFPCTERHIILSIVHDHLHCNLETAGLKIQMLWISHERRINKLQIWHRKSALA